GLIPPIQAGLALRAREGALPRFRQRAYEANPPLPLGPFDVQRDEGAGQQRSNRFEAVALWVLAGLAAATAVAVFGQVLARQTFLGSTENPILRAVGMSPRQLAMVSLVRAALVGGLAACIAVVTALLLSPLTPVGAARIVQPHPGISIDGA